MRHSQAIWYVEGFRADELSPALRRRLDAHLSGCSSCAKRAAESRGLFAMLAEIPRPESQGFESALESVRARTLSAVRAEERRREEPDRLRAWAGSFWRLAAVAPVAVAAAVVMIVVLRPEAPPPAPVGETVEVAVLTERSPEAVSEVASEVAEPALEAPAARETGASGDGATRRLVRSGTTVPTVTSESAGAPQTPRNQVPAEFTIVRSGSGILIQWSENGAREHQIRKGSDPVSVQVAGGLIVSGEIWTDTEAHALPGSVTYYLID